MGLVNIVEPLLRVIRSLIGSLLSLRAFVEKKKEDGRFRSSGLPSVPKSFGRAESVSVYDEQF